MIFALKVLRFFGLSLLIIDRNCFFTIVIIIYDNMTFFLTDCKLEIMTHWYINVTVVGIYSFFECLEYISLDICIINKYLHLTKPQYFNSNN